MDGQQLQISGGVYAKRIAIRETNNLTFPVACTQSASLSSTLQFDISGGDALRGHTRSHPEHDG